MTTAVVLLRVNSKLDCALLAIPAGFLCDQYIALCTVGDLKFQKQQIENLEIHDFGEFAVATMILHDQFIFAEQPYEGVFRSFCAFRKIDGSWRWLGGQTSAE